MSLSSVCSENAFGKIAALMMIIQWIEHIHTQKWEPNWYARKHPWAYQRFRNCLVRQATWMIMGWGVCCEKNIWNNAKLNVSFNFGEWNANKRLMFTHCDKSNSSCEWNIPDCKIMIGLIEWLLMFNFLRGNWIAHTYSRVLEILEETQKKIHEICKRGKLWWNKMKTDEILKKAENSSSELRKRRNVRKTTRVKDERGRKNEKECETGTKSEKKNAKKIHIRLNTWTFPDVYRHRIDQKSNVKCHFYFSTLDTFFCTHLKKSNTLDISILITRIN